MALDSAIGVISQWSSASDNNSYVFSGQRAEIDQYLQAVDEIQRSLDSGTAYDQSRAKSAIQIAMLRLADEMSNILKVNGEPTGDPDSGTYSSTMTDSASNSYEDDYLYDNTFSLVVIDDLRSITKRMKGAGYLPDCKKTYVSQRKRCIDASYQRLKIPELSSDDAKKLKWEDLKLIIGMWKKSAKICFIKVFAYEKQLCDKILGDIGDDTDVDCFLETVNDYAVKLMEIATNLSCVKIASERLFGILELYTTLSDLLPEINKLFNTQSSEPFTTMASQILFKFAEAASMTMEKFEKDLLTADLSRHVSVDKIHELSKYVMEYVFKLSENKQILMELSLFKPPSTSGVGMDMEVRLLKKNKFPFHVIWIVMFLVSKLESQAANSYINASDKTYFFLMYNFHYIIKKINGWPEVKELIGDDCLKKLSGKFNQAKAEYLRLTFVKVLSILGDETPSKKSLKSFNAEFGKLKINLAPLKVPDFQLLKDLRVSMEEMMVPAYTTFLGRLSGSSRLTDNATLPAEELKTAIRSFFTST